MTKVEMKEMVMIALKARVSTLAMQIDCIQKDGRRNGTTTASVMIKMFNDEMDKLEKVLDIVEAL